MIISTDLFLAIGTTAAGGIGMIVAGSIAWGKLNAKIDGNATEIDKQEAKVNAFFNKRDESEKEFNSYRLEQQQKLGEISAKIQVHDGNYQELLRIMRSMQDSIEKRFDKLEEDIRGDRQ